MKYGNALKTHRKENGFTLEYVAKAIKTSKQNISRWERNEVEPTITFCVQLADFYGISLDELIGRDIHYTEPNVNNSIIQHGNNNTATINHNK